MSDIKQIALSAAIQARNPDESAEEIVNCAKIFEAYIMGSETVKTAKVEKPAKVEREVKQPEAPIGPSIDDVKNKVNELLQANLRNVALDLFGKYKAKNASGLKTEDYAAFIEAADAALIAA